MPTTVLSSPFYDVTPAGGGSWHSAKRPRSKVNAWVAKARWSRTLRPKPVRPVTARLLPAAPSDWSVAAGLGTIQGRGEGEQGIGK